MKRLLSLWLLAALFVVNGIKAQTVDLPTTVSGNSGLSDANGEERDGDDDYRIWKKRAKYFNFGYVKQSLTSKDDYGKYKSDFGVSINWGKTWYLHKKPIAKMIKIGLDWSWMDFNYVKYSSMADELYGEYDWDNYGDYYEEDGEEFNIGCHQLEYGMQIGPSITINPVHDLKIATYVRFQPSFSALILDEEAYYGFVPFINFGMSVSWKAISVGVEGRWGSAKYHGISVDEEGIGNDDDYDYSDYLSNGSFNVSSAFSDVTGDVLDTFRESMKIKTFRVYIGFRF